MHAVFRFVKHDRTLAFKSLVGDLHARDAETFVYLFTDRRFQVVERGQTVHEHAIRAGLFQPLHGYAIGRQFADAFLPNFIRLSHGNPHVGIQHLRVAYGDVGVVAKFQNGAGFGGDGFAGFDELLVREIFLRRTGDKMHPHFGTAHHKRIAHIIPGIAHVHELDAV